MDKKRPAFPGMRTGVEVTPEQQRQLYKINDYDLAFLKSHIGAGAQPDTFDTDVAICELKKYFVLIALRVSPLGMFSNAVDTLWHRFLAFSAKYREFCLEVFEGLIDHKPNTPSTPVPRIALRNFLLGYEKYFGSIPTVWFDSVDRDKLEAFCNNDENEVSPVKWSGWTGAIVLISELQHQAYGSTSE